MQTYVSEGIDEHLSHSCSIEWSCIYVVLTRVLRYLCFLLYFSVMFLGTLSKSKSFKVTIVLLFAIFFSADGIKTLTQTVIEQNVCWP